MVFEKAARKAASFGEIGTTVAARCSARDMRFVVTCVRSVLFTGLGGAWFEEEETLED